MSDETFYYAYIVFKEIIPDESTKGKLSSLIKNLNGSIYFAQTICESYGFLIFKNPISKSNILPHLSAYSIEESDFTPIPGPTSESDSPLFITNLPDGCKNPDLDSILHVFDKNSSVEDTIPNILTYLIPTKKNLLSTFLPYIKFKKDVNISVTTDSFQAPIIVVSNLPINFRKKEFALFKCPYKLVNCEFKKEEEQEQLSKSAYLSFSTNEEANKAIEYFNFAQIDQNEINAIHYVQKDIIKTFKGWEISVKHISPESKAFDLWHRFKIYGPILSAEIIRDSNSVYGIVQFYHRENAEAAIKDISQQNTSIIVDYTVNFVVTIYNVDPSLTQQDIAQCFKQISKIEIVSSARGLMGSAIVTFYTTHAAENCLNSHKVFNGVRWLFKKGPQKKTQKSSVKSTFNKYQEENTIKVKNLNKGTQLQALIENYSQYGIIRYISINSDTATVSFEDEKSAAEASASLSC